MYFEALTPKSYTRIKMPLFRDTFIQVQVLHSKNLKIYSLISITFWVYFVSFMFGDHLNHINKKVIVKEPKI